MRKIRLLKKCSLILIVLGLGLNNIIPNQVYASNLINEPSTPPLNEKEKEGEKKSEKLQNEEKKESEENKEPDLTGTVEPEENKEPIEENLVGDDQKNKETNLQRSFEYKSITTDTIYFTFGKQNTITGYAASLDAPKDIVIPETYIDPEGIEQDVLYIDENAFSGVGITSVVINNKLSEIRAGAFKNTINLTSITLGTGIQTIGTEAFKGSALTSVSIPGNVKRIESSAFYNCKDLASITLEEGIQTIGDSAFSGDFITTDVRPKITEINIPASVTDIGNSVFLGCMTLEKVDFSNGTNIMSIGNKAFYSTKSEISINLVDKELNSISGAPWGNITAQVYWKLTGNSCYYEKDGVVYGFVPISHPNHTSCVQNYDHTYVQIPTTIGQAVTAIAPSAFANNATIKSISFPEGLVSIGKNAFLKSTEVTTLTIPNSVEIIGASAFSGNKKLAALTLGTGVITIEESAFQETAIVNLNIPGNVKSINKSAFYKVPTLTNLTIEEGLETIGDSAFNNSGVTANSLKQVSLPNSLVSIGNNAFYFNRGLESVNIGSGIKTIGNNVFSNTSSNLKIKILSKEALSIDGAPWGNSSAVVYWKTTGNSCYYEKEGVIYGLVPLDHENHGSCTNGHVDIVIPETIDGQQITAISNKAFYNESKIKTVAIGENIVGIGDSAFEGCGSITEINIAGNRIETIGLNAFASTKTGTSGLKINILSKPVDSIKGMPWGNPNLRVYWELNGDSCYYEGDGTILGFIPLDHPDHLNCGGNHKNVEIPNVINGREIKSISADAFQNNSSIISVKIPNSVETIGERAFLKCTNLADLDLGNGVKTIGNEAFSNVKITNIVIPNSVGTISTKAFKNCTKVVSITIGNHVKTIGEEAFYGLKLVKSLKIPDSVLDIGNRAFATLNALEDLDLGSGVKQIGESAFTASKISNLIIPDSVIKIGLAAFYNCPQLTNVILGNGLEEIGESAFARTPVNNIVIPNSVTTIGDFAFSFCDQLANFTMGKNVTTIGEEILSDSLFKSIELPETLETLHEYAFRYSNLENIYVPVPRGSTSFGNTEPWGAKNTTKVLYRGEYIQGSETKLLKEDKSSMNVTMDFTSEEGGNIEQITLPNGDLIENIGKDTWSVETEFSQNGVYTFTVTSSYPQTRTFNVIVEGIEPIILTAEDAIIPENMINTLTKEEILGKTMANAYLNANKQVLDIAILTPINDIKAALNAPGSTRSIDILLRAEGSLPNESITHSKEIMVKLTSTKKNIFSVTFKDVNGNIIGTKNVVEDETFVPIPNPDRNGYTFEGWYSDELLADKYDFTQPLTSALTLYAKYIPTEYTITYDNLVGSTTTNPITYNIETATITLSDPTARTGYTFEGWYDGSDIKVTTISQGTTGNIALTAKWAPMGYSITYNNLADSTTTNPITYTMETPTITLTDPTARMGYTFEGWYDGTNIKVTTITQGTTGNITLAAKWAPIPYTIDYILDGGTNSSTNPPTYTIESEDIVLAHPTKENHTFTGWTWDGQTTPTKDVTITKGNTGNLSYTANWEVNKYDVTFNSHGGTEIANQTIEHGQTVTNPADPTREHYTFIGWYKEATFINVWDFDNDKVTDNMTLYAKWKVEDYTINYNGLEETTHLNPNKYTIETDNIILVDPSNRTGYTFVGWFDEKNQEVTEIKKGSTGNKILTARWEENNTTVSILEEKVMVLRVYNEEYNTVDSTNSSILTLQMQKAETDIPTNFSLLEWEVENIAGFESYAPVVKIDEATGKVIGLKSGVAKVTVKLKEGYDENDSSTYDTCIVIIPGDINKDGKVSSVDSIFIERIASQLDSIDTIQVNFNKEYLKELTDMNGDGKTNAMDFIIIKRMASKLDRPSN